MNLRSASEDDRPTINRGTFIDVFKGIVAGRITVGGVTRQQAARCLEALGEKLDPVDERRGAGGDEKARAFVDQKMGLRAEGSGIKRAGIGGRTLSLGSMSPPEARAFLAQNGSPEDRERFGGGRP